MKKGTLLLSSLLLGLLSTVVMVVPGWSESTGGVAYTRYKWGSGYASPGCCNSIYAQDYDCLGRRIEQWTGRSCYNTGSGDSIIGTCGGGCVMPTCGGHPTKICVIDQANIGCGHCDVFLEPLPGSPPANCTSQVDPACGQRYGCGTPGGWPCYTQPYDASGDLDSGYLCDKRTAAMIAAGCNPPDLSSCPSISNFNGDVTTINLSAGQKVNLTGGIASGSGGSINWSLSVAGQTLAGTGDSVSVFWDGKDSEKKQVWPGTYPAKLEVQSSESCSTSEAKSIPIEVKSNDQPVACPVDLKAKFGSSVNVASGSLSHSQTLFYLSNSKFQDDFTLSYNSLDGQKTPLGTGWSHTYNIYLHSNNNGSYTLVEGDGGRITLYKNGDRYTPENSNYPFLIVSGDGTSILERKEGIFYQFDQGGKITRILDQNSNAVTFTYDSQSNLVLITDPSGRNISFAYNSDKRITRITDPNGNIHSFTYAGETLAGISSQIQGLGMQSWSNTYDANGFLLTKTDPRGYVTSYVYDGEFRVVQATDPEGKTRSMAYNPGASTSQFTEKDGGVWTYRYDPKIGALTEKTDPLGNTTKYAYDQNRNLSSIIDPKGNPTQFAYDANGNMISSTDAQGNITTYAYNSLNKVTGITYPGNALVTMAYDLNGNLTAVTDPLGNPTRYTYDSRGNLLGTLSPLNQLTTFAYDAHDYLSSLTDPAGAGTAFGYDPSGRVIKYTDPLGNKIALEYNGLGKVTKATDPKGSILAYGYDAGGNMAAMTDANGKKTFYNYNYRGQATKITDALNQVTQFSYGSGCPSCGVGVEKLTSLTDAKGNTTAFEYNLSGWLSKETSPLGYGKSYTYDAAGNLISRMDENGSVTQYVYDNLNRLTSIKYTNGDTTTFGYDSKGNMISAANQNIGYTFTYDLNNRLTSVSDSTGKSISYQYDALGNRTQMTTPDGQTLTYQYDIANRLSQILSHVGAFTLSYDPSGRRTGLAYPNGLRTKYAYDPSGYLTNLETLKSKKTIDSFAYTQDAMGNRTSEIDFSGPYKFTYDSIYQLIQAIHPTTIEKYNYDSVGNRVAKKVVDTDNRLLENNRHLYEYDGCGNLTKKVNKVTTVATIYSYDGENRLVKIESPGKVVEYKYDPLGRRIEKNVDGVISRYLYDGPNIVLEYNAKGGVKSSYLHGPRIDEPLALKRGKQVYYYHADGLGSVTELTNSSGVIVKSYQYKGFGQIDSQSGSLSQPFTFTGREHDPESGLYYYRARYYNPRVGRFLTKDPIGFAGGDVNPYRYTRNNPINFRDPWGLWREDVHSGMGNPHFGTFTWALGVGFSVSEAKVIAMANNATDYYAGWAVVAGVTGRHFDTSFGPVDSRDLFAEFDLNLAVKQYKEGNPCGALKTLGRGLHSIQDKVAHGSWPFFLVHPDWFDDPYQRPKELKQTEILTQEYLRTFFRRTNR